MANSIITPSMVAPMALANLENELVVGNLVYRDLESEFEESYIGNTISIRRPLQYTVRTTSVASVQDSTEGKTTMVVDQIAGVDVQFSSTELTLDIKQFSERYVKPAMIRIANQIDSTAFTEFYKRTNNWVGTPGQTLNSATDFFKGPERLDELAVPQDNRVAILSPADYWGMVGGFSGGNSGFFQQDVTKTALQKAKLPMLGNVDAYMSQNVATHTNGAHGGTPLVRGASQNVTYSSVKDTAYLSQTFQTDGWSTSVVLKAGDVFTIDGVYDVNPVTKATLPHLKQFTLISDVTTNGTSSNATELTIAPAIISSGAYQNVSAAPANDAPINYLGTASTGYRQNLVFHKNAFALACVPMVLPSGAVNPARYTKNGFSIRVIPVYDGTNDLNMWRFDVLYGIRAIDPRLSTRLSGTS